MTRGDIELESGSWNWTVTELEGDTEAYLAGAKPVNEADPARLESGQTLLLLEDPKDPQHWMSRELPPGSADQPMEEEEVRTLARDPDRRNVVDPEGTIWTIDRIRRPPSTRSEAEFERGSHKVRASPTGGQERTLSLPDGSSLGSVTREEIVRLVRG